MTWRRFWAYRQLLSEEFVLAPERAQIAALRAEEDRQFEASAKALQRMK